MKYVKLGNTGVDVSAVCVGAMGFGKAEGWVHNPWALSEEEAQPIVKMALDAGINFFDTAEVYARGVSEQILGKALRNYASRENIVVATKINPQAGSLRGGAHGGGTSRKAMMAKIDRSLKNLGMDYVDLYILHRWDYGTPIEETMDAFNDVVKAGKVRYIGASAMFAHQFQKALYTSEKHGWTRFVSMQNHLNLIYREEEREMIPLCKEEKIALTPYSPLASGRLARPIAESTTRFETDPIAKNKYGAMESADRMVTERLAELSESRGVPRAQLALAWLMQKEPVTIPVVGAMKRAHLEDAVAAVDVKLSPEEVAFLEEPYVPHGIVGHS